MGLLVTPGPLPVNDGQRLHVEPQLTAFVNGTNVANLGRREFEGGVVDLVTATTEAPPSNERTRSTLWFKRGEGVLYKWELNPTGATGGRWLAMSTRREKLVHIVGNAGPGANQVLWPDTTLSEARVASGRFERMVMSFAATASSSAYPRAGLIGPFTVVSTGGGVGDLLIGLEVGFGDLRVVEGMPALANVGKSTSNLSPDFDQVSDPYAGTDMSESLGLGWLADSGASGSGNQLGFFFGEPTNLVL